MDKKCISGTDAKEADRIAIQELGIGSLFLMENASRAVTEFTVSHHSPETEILILSGVGNNGADGICVGKQLLELGYQPKLCIFGKVEKGSYEFFQQLSDYKRLQGQIQFFRDEAELSSLSDLASGFSDSPEKVKTQPVLIDAIFGIGLKRPVAGLFRSVLLWADSLPYEKIAIDMPSGINADSGELMSCGIHADTTITFGRNKIGLCQGTGKSYAGNILVKEIGIPDEVYNKFFS